VAILLGCDVHGFRWDIVMLLQRVVSILGIHLVNQPRTAEAHINSHASPWVYLWSLESYCHPCLDRGPCVAARTAWPDE
jgi:hypothetical protein